MTLRIRRARAVVCLVVAALGVSACGGLDDTATTPTTAAVVPVAVDYSGFGPYAVGHTRLALPEGEVLVVYPADAASVTDAEPVSGYGPADVLAPDVVAAVPAGLVPTVELSGYREPRLSSEGPFPVVLYSHDFAGTWADSTLQVEHLASWGFVVASPQHRQRDLAAALFGATAGAADDRDVAVLRALLARLATENTTIGSVLVNGLDLDHVGAIGHGEGARAVALLAGDPRVDVWIGQAPEPPVSRLEGLEALAPPPVADRLAALSPPTKPSLLVAGEADGFVTLDAVRSVYEWLPAPKRLAVLAGAGRQVFTDRCAGVREQGGMGSLWEALPGSLDLLVRLEDGCTPAFADPAPARAVTAHLDVAQLRWAFGLDADDSSLRPDYVDATFPGALAAYEVTE